MGKRSILKFLSCLTFWFVSQVFAVDSADLLPPDQAFQFTSKVKKADRLLLSWNIADGYYLYRQKFKFVSLTPGLKVGEESFPASQTKHDATFGKVEIFRDHLEVEVLLQRQDTKLNKLMLEVTFQGCADAGVCYMPIKESVSLDLSDESFNWWGNVSMPDKTILTSYRRKTIDTPDFLFLPGRRNPVHQGIAERLVVLLGPFALPTTLCQMRRRDYDNGIN